MQCARLAQGIKQETDQVTGKRDLARLSPWFEYFSQHAGEVQQHRKQEVFCGGSVRTSRLGVLHKGCLNTSKYFVLPGSLTSCCSEWRQLHPVRGPEVCCQASVHCLLHLPSGHWEEGGEGAGVARGGSALSLAAAKLQQSFTTRHCAANLALAACTSSLLLLIRTNVINNTNNNDNNKYLY